MLLLTLTVVSTLSLLDNRTLCIAKYIETFKCVYFLSFMNMLYDYRNWTCLFLKLSKSLNCTRSKWFNSFGLTGMNGYMYQSGFILPYTKWTFAASGTCSSKLCFSTWNGTSLPFAKNYNQTVPKSKRTQDFCVKSYQRLSQNVPSNKLIIYPYKQKYKIENPWNFVQLCDFFSLFLVCF